MVKTVTSRFKNRLGKKTSWDIHPEISLDMDHGPSILSLSGEQKKWLSQVHHRLGHPDAQTLSRYLKSTEAEPALIDGARDYQCDACSETRRGYDLPKVGGIHENLGFSHTIGMDGAVWDQLKRKIVFFHTRH